MKKTILITIAALCMIACKKTAPPAKASSTQSYTISPTETALLGVWLLDSTQYIVNGTMQPGLTAMPCYPGNSGLILYSSQNGTSLPQDGWKDANDGTTTACSGHSSLWKVVGTTDFNLSNSYYTIVSYSATQFVFQTKSGTGYKYYLHK